MLVAGGELLVVGVTTGRQARARRSPITDHRSPITDKTSA